MRIHVSKAVQSATIQNSAMQANVWGDFTEHGSRSHDHAYEVKLSGNSPYKRNDNSGEYAATWDQWGVFIAAIFDVDPDAKMTYYANAEDFHWQTANRFADGMPEDSHARHSWEYDGDNSTHTYSVHHCTKCSAVTRHGHREIVYV